MRVAVVFYNLEPTGGGMHTFVDDVYAALRRLEPETDHEWVYYAAGGGHATPGVRAIPNALPARWRSRMLDTVRGAYDRAGASRPALSSWLERSLEDQDVDLVWFAANYVEAVNRPYVMTVFDVEHARQPWYPEVSRDGEWQRRQQHYARFIPAATRVIVPNEVGRDQIVRLYAADPERVLCLPHSVPTFAAEAGARPPLPRDAVDRLGVRAPYLLYPAQFWPHKNHLLLLEAIAELERDGGQPYELVLVGADKGSLEPVRAHAEALGIAERVKTLGFVQRHELVALYQHAHALTYASVFGPENLPPLEAMALGCAVIAAEVPGASLQLGDAAILVPTDDAAAVATAVRRLEDDGARAALVDRGRELAGARTPDAYVGGVLQFLDSFARVARAWRPPAPA